MLDSHPKLIKSGQPTLWHKDLHMGNIYVAPNDNSQITSIIDFQSQSVLTAFLQAQWPIFLTSPPVYTQGLVLPKRPEEFEEFEALDDQGKALVRHEYSQEFMAKAYETSTIIEDKAAYKAMNVPRVFKELFTRCGEVSEFGVLPLRECLIEIFKN